MQVEEMKSTDINWAHIPVSGARYKNFAYLKTLGCTKENTFCLQTSRLAQSWRGRRQQRKKKGTVLGIHKICNITLTFGPGSSVGIATELRPGRSMIKSRWERDFSPVQTGLGAHPASCKMGTGSFPGLKCGRGVLLTTHPLLVSRSWKSRAIPLPTLWATPGR